MANAERWVTFDCYGTLIDWQRGIGDALVGLWPEVPRDELLKLYHQLEPRIQQAGPIPYREVMARCTEEIAARLGLILPPSRRYVLAESLPRWPAFPEVPMALSELRRRGWRLAILSNTDPDLLKASERQIGVTVDLHITAAEAGSYKPAPGHWHAFFAASGADRGRHVHVAQSLFHDVAPCRELGLRIVWINRLREVSTLPVDAELPDLTGLPDILDRMVPPL
jgi:2-haloalkanoic acid dehalogenase type II